MVLKRRQVSASSSAGKLALAANTNAMLTSTVTLKPEPTTSVAAIASIASPIEAPRAIFVSASSSPPPRLSTFAHRSWATVLADASTRPETTARMVANAAAENSASAMSPPVVPTPPPRLWASSGAARLPPVPTASTALAAAEDRARAEADDRHQHGEDADEADRPHHGLARRLAVRHGEEAHQDVRQPGRADEDRQPGGDDERRRRQVQARAEERLALARLGRRLVEQRRRC